MTSQPTSLVRATESGIPVSLRLELSRPADGCLFLDVFLCGRLLVVSQALRR